MPGLPGGDEGASNTHFPDVNQQAEQAQARGYQSWCIVADIERMIRILKNYVKTYSYFIRRKVGILSRGL